MSEFSEDCKIHNNSDKFGGNMRADGDGRAMGKEDRKRRVLQYLYETDSALPPAAIFRNVKLRGADFERRSVDNYLPELAEEGLVIKVDAEALEKREIVEIPLDKDGYYIITEKGKEIFE